MEKPTCPDPVRPMVFAGPAAGEPAAKKSDGGVGEGTAPGCGWISRTCIGRWLPEEYVEELHKVLRLTGPLVSRGELLSDVAWTLDLHHAQLLTSPFLLFQLLSRLLNFLLKFTTSIFCGHIGNSELAGYALASTVRGDARCAAWTSSTALIFLHAAPALLHVHTVRLINTDLSIEGKNSTQALNCATNPISSIICSVSNNRLLLRWKCNYSQTLLQA